MEQTIQDEDLCTVCDLPAKSGDSPLSIEYMGSLYEFCSEKCYELFCADPSAYFDEEEEAED